MEPFPEANEAEGTFAPAERDSSVMQVIGEEDLLGFTFEGLKRRLGTHPETLSRILARLEEQGMLSKTDDGYTVTERGRNLSGAGRLRHQRQGVVLLRTLLPDYQSGRVISGLMGRWFGPLRWLGYSREGDATILKWTTEGGNVQVDAVFQGTELVVEGRSRAGKDLSGAIAASLQLVGYISRFYAQPHQKLAYYKHGEQGLLEN